MPLNAVLREMVRREDKHFTISQLVNKMNFKFLFFNDQLLNCGGKKKKLLDLCRWVLCGGYVVLKNCNLNCYKCNAVCHIYLVTVFHT